MRSYPKASVWIVPALLFLLLVGSAIPSAYGLTTEEEKNLGKEIFQTIERSGDILNDLSLQSFLQKIGHSLVAEVGSTPFEFKFYLIRSQEPNAFAIPGGYVFVTTGLLALAENEHEVAGVLSHEISHVTMRHISQLIDRSKRISIATMVAMIAGMILAGGGTGSEAIAATAMATSEALMLKYTRENETEADQNGLHYLVKAGYDPNGLTSFMKKMWKYGLVTAPKLPTYLSTHPATEDRISVLENLIQTEPRRTGSLKTVGNYKRVQTRAFVEETAPDMAVSHFESIVKNNPEDVFGMLGLGLAHRKTGRLDKSIEIFEKALSVDPREPEILGELGVSYFLSGKLEQAIRNLERVRSFSPTETRQEEDLKTLYYLGRAYQEKAEFSKAVELLLKVQKEAPGFAEVYQSLGSVYGRMGSKGQSHFYFGKYFKLRGDENSARLHFRTALEGLERGSPEREEAQREIKELARER